MAGRTLDLKDIMNPDALACGIANKYQEWESMRNQWLEEKEGDS
jgi:hypothetical protein